MTTKITPLHPLFGARLEGVDLRADRSPAAMAIIERALDQYAVVALPGQFLDDDTQLAVSELLGDLSRALNPGRAKTQATRLRAELYDISNLDENNGILAESNGSVKVTTNSSGLGVINTITGQHGDGKAVGQAELRVEHGHHVLFAQLFKVQCVAAHGDARRRG